jgi:hypothetical protein
VDSAFSLGGAEPEVPVPVPVIDRAARGLRSRGKGRYSPPAIRTRLVVTEAADAVVARVRVADVLDWNEATRRIQARVRARCAPLEAADAVSARCPRPSVARIAVTDVGDRAQARGRVNDDELIAEHMNEVLRLFRMTG